MEDGDMVKHWTLGGRWAAHWRWAKGAVKRSTQHFGLRANGKKVKFARATFAKAKCSITLSFGRCLLKALQNQNHAECQTPEGTLSAEIGPECGNEWGNRAGVRK